MAGHSKWKNIAHRKGKQDASRGQLFTKLCRDIYAAAKRGGANPDVNYTLKVALEKAKENSVPSDTIARTLAKATGTLDGMHLESFLYEGYGPGGFAVLLEISSSNRNRTAAEIRHLFSKHGGSLGESGCVAWMFLRRGAVRVTLDARLDETDLTLFALEVGADDVQEEEDECVFYTEPEALSEVEKSVVARGFQPSAVEIIYVPTVAANVSEEDQERAATLLTLLEEHDDVDNLYTNVDFSAS
ncbi:YebC/PmpR family DNA-binding transcriptional regulator [Ferroacidibacillus organovorans]|uniref:Probable transcriptional regulatory protein AYW79_12170 n=1 Tax=Ferroacidibacillus organovorans TaxID=1765683 RepID=A0A162RY28_9BACL|nr:YebC/PmpR family DNA-binding transcriptional regulator [Ferroacidibacillus organovorans]KYP79354.1 transcriptional regulator [Ferroacidibacillus organovorans]OAG93139.1 transcriptional regulator [Ferroacidibacillus organovorans]OPG15945.1 YebC/PmpR family DNA-binding transcriptional regulator [Ferroacidibacillus organovorans]